MKKCFLLALSLLFATIVNAQLSGTYTINSNSSANPDYTSLSAAASALAAGVSGQVVFEIAPGTYEEYVNFDEINGVSETNRVIFRGMGADNQQVVVTSNAGYTDNSTIKLYKADYVTFENMTITSTSQNKAVLVKLMNGNTGLRFENVRFVGAVSTNNLDSDKSLVYRISGEWVDQDNEFVGCHFENGYVGLYYQGNNIYTLNDGVLVENCTFLNQSFKGIYILFTDHAIVRGNTVTNHTHDVLGNYHAMDLMRIRNGSIVENNVMNVTRNSNYATIFETRPAMGTETEPIIIRNNIINLVSNVNSSWCCELDDSNSSYVYFVNNTVKCSGSGNCGLMYVDKNWSNLFMYNNLFVNETAGYVFRFQQNATDRFCDYNRIQFAGTNLGKFTGTDCATLADWTAATGFDTHSALCTPNFVGNNDLHITDATGLTVANPLSYVPTDIDGDSRSNSPCAGADEYATGTNLPPVVANQLAPINFTEYPQTLHFDLSNVFDDPDNNNEFIEITVQSCPSEISATIDYSDMLWVTRTTSNAFTNKTLVIRATSNGKYVDMNVSVSGNDVTITVGTATFDDVTLGANGYWQGESGENDMYSGGWLFYNYYMPEYMFWGGFTASNHTDMTQSGLEAQYTSASGGGYDGSTQYGVAYAMGVQCDVHAADGQAHTVTGCYVTNNLWAYQNIHDGDATATPFGGPSGNDPDWFKLTAIGKNASGQTVGTAEIYLADYRFANNDEDYVLNTWEWFDLSTLGAVHTISFSLSSSKNDAGGMVTPAYFCIENFNGEAPTPPQDLPPYVVNPVGDIDFTSFPEIVYVNLENVVTDDDDPDENIDFNILSISNVDYIYAVMQGKRLKMTRVSREEAIVTIAMRAYSDGQYVDFDVRAILHYVPDGIEENELNISIYPNPAHDFVTVETRLIAPLQSISICDITGKMILSSTESRIDISALPEGVYFITVLTENQKFVEKFIKK